MPSSRPTVLAALAVAAAISSPLVAHEDDGKVFDRVPPFEGPIFRAGEGGIADAAGQFEFSGVTLLSWLPLNAFGENIDNGNVCEGYVSPSGREYALMGLSTGTAFVEITDPSNAQILTVIPGPLSLWRDIKVYGHHAYAVSEGGGGIQVFDMSQIDSGEVTLVNTVTEGGAGSTHTLAVDPDSGFLFRAGGSGNGLRIYSLADPANPDFVAEWQDRYVHECSPFTYTEGQYAGRQIVFCCGGFNSGWVDSGLSILDVTDKSNIVVLSNYLYPNAQYSHQGWLTADRRYFYLNDEKDEQNLGLPGTTRIIDVQDLSAPAQIGTWTNGLPAIDHNLYIRGNLAFLSNYRSGLRVLDVSDPLAPVEVGFFDTYPGSNGASFNGLWDNYPFFPSGIVIGSDIERGLFVWYVGPPPLNFSFPDGLPSLLDPAGGQMLTVGVTALENLSVVPGSVQLNVSTMQGLVTVPATEISPGVFAAPSPALPCEEAVSYTFTAQASNGITLSGPTPPAEAVAAVAETVAFADAMELDSGWTVGAPGDNATSGIWVRVDPVGTSAQPEDDSTPPPGTHCWVTGQGEPGGGAGDADVDAGKTTLLSPIFDATVAENVLVQYRRWYSNNLGNNPDNDSMPVSISNDGGETWTLLENVTENAGVWVARSFRISDFLVPTAQMRLRFEASDVNGPSLVEAGVDDVKVVAYACTGGKVIPGDLDGSGSVDGADLGILLGAWGASGGPADLNDDGVVDGADLGILLGNWG